METKKRLINILAGISKIVLILSIVFVTAIFTIISIQLLSEKSSTYNKEYVSVNLVHEYNASLTLDTEISYRNGESINTKIKTSTISAPITLKGSKTMTILYLILLLLLLGNVIFLIYQFYKIFIGLKQSQKQGTFFFKNIYIHIKWVAYSIFAFAGIKILNKLFFFYSIKKIEILNQTADTSITFGSDTFINIFFGLVILLIAAIFREGLKLKQENELTI